MAVIIAIVAAGWVLSGEFGDKYGVADKTAGDQAKPEQATSVVVGAGCAYICFLRPQEIGAGEDTGQQEGLRAGSGITMLLSLGLLWQPVEPTVQSL